jgi:spore coat protein U-like protein
MKTMKKLIAACAVAAALPVFAGEESGQSQIQGEIVGSCTIGLTSLDFGQISLGQNINANISVQVNCTNGLTYKLFLDPAYTVQYTASAANNNAISNATGTIAASEIVLANDGSAMGKILYQDGDNNPFPISLASAPARTGTGSNQFIPLELKWETNGITAGPKTFSKFLVTNTYKVVF